MGTNKNTETLEKNEFKILKNINDNMIQKTSSITELSPKTVNNHISASKKQGYIEINAGIGVITPNGQKRLDDLRKKYPEEDHSAGFMSHVSGDNFASSGTVAIPNINQSFETLKFAKIYNEEWKEFGNRLHNRISSSSEAISKKIKINASLDF